MANRNNHNYRDFDNFDDSYNVRNRRRRPTQKRQSPDKRQSPQRRQSPQKRQSPYKKRPSSNARSRRRRNQKRTRNRIIMVSCAILLVIFFIVLVSTMFRGCSGASNNKIISVSTDTKDKQNASNQAETPTTPAVKDDLSPAYFVTPQIKDNKTDGEMYSGVYVWNGAAYELFAKSEQGAKNYADAINGFADKLMGMTVYNMIIPNHTEMGLPQRLKESSATTSSQAENIKYIYSKFTDKVTPINAYNYLANHNSEYIYFESDEHWTGLGAYYAYSAFADTTKQPAISLSSCTEQTIEGFTGSFASNIGNLNSDTVHYWEFPYDIQMDITDENGEVSTYEGPYYQYASDGSLTYGVFIVGDHPLVVLKSSSDKANGKKIAVVKESYGNAFVPYLTYNYEEVHVIDYNNYNENLLSYCQSNGIDDVLFINNITSANTQSQIDSMASLFN